MDTIFSDIIINHKGHAMISKRAEMPILTNDSRVIYISLTGISISLRIKIGPADIKTCKTIQEEQSRIETRRYLLR